MNKHIGQCSQCGGDVVIHRGAWHGINPPRPTCSRCGATERKPVIQMHGGKDSHAALDEATRIAQEDGGYE